MTELASTSSVTRAEFEDLRRAVEVLASRLDPATASSEPSAHGQAGELWALDGLRRRLDDPDGGVLFTGSVSLDGSGPHLWQQAATTVSLLESDWSELAPSLDALGHPVRLQLLQLVASGVHRTAELAEADGLGTTGQLHHHLRQLVAAGWLRSAGRGSYEIPVQRAVPLLVVLAAAQR